MSLSRERVVAAKARADAATEGPWFDADSDSYGGLVWFVETAPDPYDPSGYTPMQVQSIVGSGMNRTDAEFIAASREDVPVMADALLRVLDLHRRAHAVFSWNSGTKYEDPCPHCDGKAGVHDCGCWADRDIEYVCAECHRLGARSSGVYDYAWPCATVRAVTGDGSSSNTERSEQ